MSLEADMENLSDMQVKAYDYDLPAELIAQDPLSDRSASRLMMLNKDTGEITHETFKNIINYLRPSDCLVLNETRVIPARLIGRRLLNDKDNNESKGAVVEFLLLKRIKDKKDCWEVLVKPGKKAKPKDTISFGDGLLKGHVLEILDDGKRLVNFTYQGVFEEILDKLGALPLPPYIKHKLQDKERYQTVYAKNDGSAAAPTAGLHFTNELLKEIKYKGVNIAKLTLHVGLGTFRPVKVDNILEHKMHSEYYTISNEAADLINKSKRAGNRIIAVGTTATRAMESAADENGLIKPGSNETSIFIYPGYSFKVIDSLITNFHLPGSTLLMLVSALAGRKKILKAYREAIKEKYRFFSFGDAMFIYGDNK